MFGLDDQIASLGAGEAFLIVAVVAILLGLRHATDPDHLTAVSTLVAGDGADTRGAGRLGLAWGMGHATTLFAFGLPIVLYRSYLPEAVQTGAETLIGLLWGDGQSYLRQAPNWHPDRFTDFGGLIKFALDL